MSELGGYLFQALLTLLILAVLAVAVVWWLRRMGTGGWRGGGQITVADQLVLGMGVRLMIVEVDGRRLLVAVTPQTVALLCELSRTESESTDA